MCTRYKLKAVVIAGICLVCLFLTVSNVPALDVLMKGPPKVTPYRSVQRGLETSCVKLAFGASIRFFQKRISPVDGTGRCGFTPSCSAYGYQAVSEQGPLVGLMMIGDRLTRCNIWKRPGADYTLLPNGKLYDPPRQNLLHKTQ